MQDRDVIENVISHHFIKGGIMRKPVYYAYVTQETQPDLQGDKNTYWTKVGVAFSHNGKSGLNIVLTPGIAVSGKLVLLEPREDNNPPQSTVPGETAL
jgi:hypothetical protein